MFKIFYILYYLQGTKGNTFKKYSIFCSVYKEQKVIHLKNILYSVLFIRNKR